MKIIVTGGTGFIGRRLVRTLIAAGHTVTVLTRDTVQAAKQLPARCGVQAWHPAEAVDPSVLRAADAVMHLAGEGVAEARWTASRKQAIRDSRISSSRALVQAMLALPAAERPRILVAASAIGFYGDRGNELLAEMSERGSGFLADVCGDWEQEVLAARHAGIRAAAVRVGIVLGKDGGALAKMLPPFRLGVGGRIGSGRQWMSWIHIDDLVDLFVFLLERDDASGPVNGVAPTPVRNAFFTKTLARVLRRHALLPIPATALRLLLGEIAGLMLASQRVVPDVAARLGFRFRFATLSDALTDVCTDLGHELVREQWLPRSPEEIFPFFSEPRNLERITPDFLGFRVLGTSTPDIRAGTLIDYRLSLHHVPLRWQSRIESWKPNASFVDVQIKGPYRVWHHVHEFEPSNGGTIVRDRVGYALPFGVVGDLVAGAWVARDLQRVFDFRMESIREALA